MPLVLTTVQPRHLSRARLHHPDGTPRVRDGELEAVANHTLSSALRQLACLAGIAGKMFDSLGQEVATLGARSKALRSRVDSLQVAVDQLDPKAVTVPEGDLSWFCSVKQHWRRDRPVDKELFTPSTRPRDLAALYQAAASRPAPPIHPVLSPPRPPRTLPFHDIETSKPAWVRGVRRWTSSEALGSLTCEPDASLRVCPSDQADHTLPSPEEQLTAVASRFPAEVVRVDVSGKGFDRMSAVRRSLVTGVVLEGETRRRKGARRRTPRRNTIASTDSKQLEAALNHTGGGCEVSVGKSWLESLGGLDKKSHLESLKEWGRGRLRRLREAEVKLRATTARHWDEAQAPHSSSGNWSASSESGHSTTTTHHPRSSLSSSTASVKAASVARRPVVTSASSSVTSESTLTPDDVDSGSMYSCDTEGYYTSFHLDSGLKPLREEEPSPALQSCSALSATAESEYDLFGRGSTSTTASSAGTVCTALVGAPPTPPRTSSAASNALEGNRTFPERSRPAAPPTTRSLRLDKETLPYLNKENLSRLLDPRVGEKCGDSPDSGHNTCSSPVSASPSLDTEASECSDPDTSDRTERIRAKTAIDSSRIPSMCVITPPQSDDERAHSPPEGEYITIAEVRTHTELVSLNELPPPGRRYGARVTLDAEGRVVYSSDSLRRKKAVHTTGTFEPGPCVASSPVARRAPRSVYERTSPSRSLRRPSPGPVPQIAQSPVATRTVVRARSPSPRPLSPPVARGAYVRVEQPSPPPCVVACSDPAVHPVKRTDSYRLAAQQPLAVNPNTLGRRQYGGPSVVATPSLLIALRQPAGDENRDREDSPQTSTPTKPSDQSPRMNLSSLPSPIEKVRSPPKTRSAMDLFAIIHDSKKRIQSLQKSWPKTIPGRAPVESGVPRPMAPLNDVSSTRYTKHGLGYSSLPRLKIQKYDESPRNLQRKHGGRWAEAPAGPTRREPRTASATRDDFKRLLLQRSTGPVFKQSAVDRLKSRTPQKPIDCDVLSSTIPEDCEADENVGTGPALETSL